MKSIEVSFLLNLTSYSLEITFRAKPFNTVIYRIYLGF